MRRLAFALLAFVAILGAQTTAPVAITASAWQPIPLPEAPLGITAHGSDLWVVGTHEMIAVSRDGGKTWSLVHQGADHMLFSINFVSPQVAYATGADKARLVSNDGGKTWDQQDSNAPIGQAQFADANTGFGESRGRIVLTHDAGMHWKPLKPSSDGPILVLDELHAMVDQGERFTSTTDGGRHWTKGPPKHRLGNQSSYSAILIGDGYQVFVNDLSDRNHAQLLAFRSTDGTNWAAGPAPATEFTQCRRSRCRTPDGWADFSGANVRYFHLPDQPHLTENWAEALDTVCEIGEIMYCAASQPEASPAPPDLNDIPDKDAVAIRTPDPAYPAQDRKQGLDGTVAIAVKIGQDGSLSDFTILDTPVTGLALPALLALRQWRYKPATRDGKPVREYAVIRVTYSLGP